MSTSAACARRLNLTPRTRLISRRCAAPATYLNPVRPRLIWKLALSSFVLWIVSLVFLDSRIARLAEQSVPGDAFPARLALWALSAMMLAGIVFLLRHLTGRTRRIQELRRFAQRMSEGDFQPLTKDPQQDDLADLGRALNEVAKAYDSAVKLLTEERNRSDTILRSMVEGVVVIEPEQKIAFANEAFCRALGLQGLPRAGRLLVEVTRQAGLLEIVQKTMQSQEVFSGELEMNCDPPRTFS